MMEIRLFGSTQVLKGDTPFGNSELGGTKPRQLLELLAIDPGTPLCKDVLAEQLWEGRPPASFVGTLESYVCMLRSRLGLRREGAAVLATTSRGYLLDPELVQVDLAVVRRLLAGTFTDVSLALDLAAGGLLSSDPYAAWAVHQREKLEAEICLACTVRARDANARKDHELAVRLATRALELDTISEPACRELMTALRALDAGSSALNAYAALRTNTREVLGVDPGPATLRLYLEILDDENTTASLRGAEADLLLTLLQEVLERDTYCLRGHPGGARVSQLLMARAQRA
jgi:DNA-binding SARP family transcriptional activator